MMEAPSVCFLILSILFILSILSNLFSIQNLGVVAQLTPVG
jgi:hypothetical protein